jgi:hypothetical protein
MSRAKGSKNLIQVLPGELSLTNEARLELIAALLIEIVCEELCTTT